MRGAGRPGGAPGARPQPSEPPEEAYALALAATPSIGPARLRRLLEAGSPAEVWRRVSGGPEGPTARVQDVEEVWRRHAALGIRVLVRGRPGYPSRLVDDPHAPGVVLCLGAPAVLGARPTVALVGTRAPTRYGIGVAAQLGAELSAAGVSVVSGLALGIDGAAHEGACGAGAPPIAVVAGGLDVPYPRRHARLWERVAGEGVVVSESPVGTRTERWRFPVRNRLLAALSDVVVVVESRHHGGARHTVDAALERGLPIGAVPGSIRSATSEGTNALLADGAFPVCGAADVLMALSLSGQGVRPDRHGPGPAHLQLREPELAGADRLVHEVLGPDPVPLEALTRSTGLGVAELCGALERLAQRGLAHGSGGWWERR